jgi:hypothetical protein
MTRDSCLINWYVHIYDLQIYQLLAHGRWFSPGTPASSTTKTGRHDIAVILLQVALKHNKSIMYIYTSVDRVKQWRYLEDNHIYVRGQG